MCELTSIKEKLEQMSSTRSMLESRPSLIETWDFEKNNKLGLDINMMTRGGNIKTWWKCSQCNGSHISTPSQKVVGSNCPYCANRKVLIGFNDMWTVNPELAKLLDDPEDGYRYTQSSRKKVDWKCSDCGNLNRNRTINQIFNYGLSCSKCSDGKSYPEKIMFSLLSQLDINFENEKMFAWLKGKQYDFYLADYNTIIEVHGAQHYAQGFDFTSGRTFKEEQENDLLKHLSAMNNNISHYIVINCSVSEIGFIRENIQKSVLNKLFNLNLVNWKTCEEYASSNLVKEVCLYYHKTSCTIVYLSKKFGLAETTIRRYLKRGASIGWGNYNPKDKVKEPIPVIQLSLDGKFIAEWKSMGEAAKALGINVSSISAAARDDNKTARGFKWAYKK